MHAQQATPDSARLLPPSIGDLSASSTLLVTQDCENVSTANNTGSMLLVDDFSYAGDDPILMPSPAALSPNSSARTSTIAFPSNSRASHPQEQGRKIP